MKESVALLPFALAEAPRFDRGPDEHRTNKPRATRR